MILHVNITTTQPDNCRSHFGEYYTHIHSIGFNGVRSVPILERCPHFRGCYVQASMELGPEDVSLLEKCPHFRGCYVQELGPEDVSLLERCPQGVMYRLQRHPLSYLHVFRCHKPWLMSQQFVDGE